VGKKRCGELPNAAAMATAEEARALGEREGRPWAGPQGEKKEGEKEKEKWAGLNRNRKGKIKVLQMVLNLILKFEFK
jgi:hypothetical protein